MKARRAFLILILAVITLGFGPCRTTNQDPLPTKIELPQQPPAAKVDVTPEADKVKKVEEEVAVEVSEIKTEGSKIKTETTLGRKKAPNLTQWSRIDESVDAIDESAGNITESSTELIEVESKLRESMTNVIELQKYTNDLERAAKAIERQNKEVVEQNRAMRADIDEFESGAAKRQQTIWMSVVGFSAVGLAIGIFMAVYADPKLGASMVIASLVLASVAYFMAKYAFFVALAGGVIVLGLIAMLVYTFGVHRKALIESITSLEITKDKKWEDARPEVSTIQSNSTKTLVHKLKMNNNI